MGVNGICNAVGACVTMLLWLSLQAVLYGYYILSAMGLRAMSPAMALMTSQEAHLSGSFRSAHQVRPTMSAP